MRKTGFPLVRGTGFLLATLRMDGLPMREIQKNFCISRGEMP